MASASPDVPALAWDDFLARIDWRQGEHVSLIGPTGSGKTTLALALLPRRSFVIALGTKPKDRTLDKLVSSGWRKIRAIKGLPEHVADYKTFRMVFWPPFKDDADVARQAHQIGAVMRWAFVNHNWCVYVDELWYLERVLGLQRLVEMLLTQGRSVGVSVVVGTQRPAHVSLLIYDQPTHLFFWKDNDERNLKRIAGINGLASALIRVTVSSLAPHECLYVNTRTGFMARTTAPEG